MFMLFKKKLKQKFLSALIRSCLQFFFGEIADKNNLKIFFLPFPFVRQFYRDLCIRKRWKCWSVSHSLSFRDIKLDHGDVSLFVYDNHNIFFRFLFPPFCILLCVYFLCKFYLIIMHNLLAFLLRDFIRIRSRTSWPTRQSWRNMHTSL